MTKQRFTKFLRRIARVGLGLVLAASAIALPITVAVPMVSAQQTYDMNWLNGLANNSNAIDEFNVAWEATTGWKDGVANAGCYQIPGHAGIIGSSNGEGSTFNLVPIGPNVWYFRAGGTFCTDEGYRAMQLSGAPSVPASRPTTLSVMAAYAMAVPYDQMIIRLDVEWSSNPSVINRWGSNGPRIYVPSWRGKPLCQQLPGNTLVWGALAEGNRHWGLEMLARNLYQTTGDGGYWCTFDGYRAMQFPQ